MPSKKGRPRNSGTLKKGQRIRAGTTLYPQYFKGKFITKATYLEMILLALTTTTQDLMLKLESGVLPIVEEIIITALLKARKDGRYDILDNIMSRIIGKVPEVVSVTDGTNEEREQRIKERSEQLLEMYKDQLGKYNVDGGRGTSGPDPSTKEVL